MKVYSIQIQAQKLFMLTYIYISLLFCNRVFSCGGPVNLFKIKIKIFPPKKQYFGRRNIADDGELCANKSPQHNRNWCEENV